MSLTGTWASEYEAALLDYLAGSGEVGLHRAYELGRRAIEENLSILDVSAAQHRLLADLIQRKDLAGPLGRANEFFTESLSPFEMTQRAYREANAALRRANAETKAANRELEAFSYSVAHDLRAPLRAVNGYSRMLLENHAEHLDDEGRRKLDKVINSAVKMDTLIEGLLRLSHLGRAALNAGEVDMTDLVQEVRQELLATCVGRNVEIRVASLGRAWGDRDLLRQVFFNLLQNAVKFSSRRPTAIIQVGSTLGQESNTYWVSDNGAGFDMRFANKLFGVFQRLHSNEEFEGTGVGLTLVQRLILRHGGRISAEASVDGGATFTFTLPCRSVGATTASLDANSIAL